MIIIKERYNIAEKSFINVGGIVKKYIESNELKKIIDSINNHDKLIFLGNCTKILFCFNESEFTFIKYINNKIIFYVDSYFIHSGASLNYVFNILKEKNISGFEYLATIPGLIGGSVVNNSSFLNQKISDNIIFVLVYENGKFEKIYKDKCDFKYRNSSLKDVFIVGVMFKKVYSTKEEIIKKNKYAINYRLKNKHQYSNTLGSTFKNKENITVGKLLDAFNLKGYRYNEFVMVSKEHCNFIIVKKNTNYLHVLGLIKYLDNILYNYLGFHLDLEINLIYHYGKSK